jgi:hypothetical protein
VGVITQFGMMGAWTAVKPPAACIVQPPAAGKNVPKPDWHPPRPLLVPTTGTAGFEGKYTEHCWPKQFANLFCLHHYLYIYNFLFFNYIYIFFIFHLFSA